MSGPSILFLQDTYCLLRGLAGRYSGFGKLRAHLRRNWQRLLGWETQVISRLENGRGVVSAYHLVLIADALRKSEPNHPAVLLADMLLPPADTPTAP